MTGTRRWARWWLFAYEAGRGLTLPRADVAASDLAVERLLAQSAPLVYARAAADTLLRAWTGSRTSHVLRPLVRDFLPLTPGQRLRVTGFLAAIGALIALALRAAGPAPADFFPWLVPAVVALAGVLVATAAEPLARALADSPQ